MNRRCPLSRITGTGSYLPPRRVTNVELAAELATRGIETSDQWIIERTGIRARHFAADGVIASDLAAAKPLGMRWKRPDARPQDIDLIIVGTSTPDMVFPSTARSCSTSSASRAARLRPAGRLLGLRLRADGRRFDDPHRRGARALVIGAEVFSRILNLNDRTTCVLFGDGAGAVVLEASDRPASWRRTCTPTAPPRHPVHAGHGGRRPGARRPAAQDGRAGGVQAGGRRARERRRAPRWRRPAAVRADIDWLIPHQANIRIMQGTAQQAEASDGQVGRHRRRARQHLGRVDSARTRRRRARTGASNAATP